VHGRDLLQDGFGRVAEIAAEVVDGLDVEALTWRPSEDANPIGWLVWHLARVQDDHVADVAGRSQVWHAGTWAVRFGLPDDEDSIGYGWSSERVGRLRPEDPAALIEYLRAVTAASTSYLATVADDDLEDVVDDGWDPPVTLAVRLVSVLSDDLQHAGQAAYVRGLWEASRR
jgi:hypothetical protein